MTNRCIGGGLARDCERGECNALDACTAMGESTSSAFRRVQQELRRVEAELGSALTALTGACEERDEARHQLAHARMKISQLETRLAYARKEDGHPCAWEGMARELLREKPGQVYPARQDVGACVLCGGQIVRGHWVEARQDGDTKPQFVHAAGVCPDKEQ